MFMAAKAWEGSSFCHASYLYLQSKAQWLTFPQIGKMKVPNFKWSYRQPFVHCDYASTYFVHYGYYAISDILRLVEV